MQQPKRVMTRYPLWLLVSVQPEYFRETPWSRDLELQTPGARPPRGMLAAVEAMFYGGLGATFSASIAIQREHFQRLPLTAVRSAGLSITTMQRSRPSPECAGRSSRRAMLQPSGTVALMSLTPGMAVRNRNAGARSWHAGEVYVGNGRTAKPATILLLS